MIFEFPDAGRFRADQAPLAKVVVTLRYPLVAAFAGLQAVQPIQERLGPEFPALEQGADTTAPQGPHGQAPSPAWIFHGGADGYRAVITPGAAELSVGRSYVDRETFSNRLQRVTNALLCGAGEQLRVCSALTVRYINATPVGAGWQQWFKPEVLGWFASGSVHAGRRFSMTQTTLEDAFVDDGVSPVATRAIVRHGLVPGITAELLPNATQVPSFVLDCELSTTAERAFDAAGIAEVFRAFNHEIARFFGFALTDAGRAQFNVQPRTD